MKFKRIGIYNVSCQESFYSVDAPDADVSINWQQGYYRAFEDTKFAEKQRLPRRREEVTMRARDLPREHAGGQRSASIEVMTPLQRRPRPPG